MDREKIVVTGAAGLLGQNLIPRLRSRGHFDIVAIDKHAANLAILRQQYPDLVVQDADLSRDGAWKTFLKDCSILVIGHAQIGGLFESEFIANNIEATKNLLAAAEEFNVRYIVHISSSVVNSQAHDFYTETKKTQEEIVAAFAVQHIVLRPTLMFGWFDRKHLGWLARFMKKSPVFPVPGSGQYLRQPLYIGDFCNIVVSAIETRMTGVYNISGQERIAYIDLIQEVKRATGSRAIVQKVPYWLFWSLLFVYAAFDRNPPFTTKQLEALVTPDEFEVIDWPGIFNIDATPLRTALEETFRHPVHSKVALSF